MTCIGGAIEERNVATEDQDKQHSSEAVEVIKQQVHAVGIET